MTETYETTILVPNSKARADYDGALAEVRQVYETEGASFIELDKWEERRLAYPIKGETSATYLIGYFTAEPGAIEKIERRARLSDAVLRQLIVSRAGKAYDKIREQRRIQAEKAAEREKEGAERATIRK